jgi:hypothetical protein
MALDQEWNDLLGEIRSLDGFADFLRPPHLDSLSRAAAGGSIVVVNISRWRSDALVVTTDGVQPPLELPSASREATVDWTVRYLDAVHRFRVAEQLAYESQRRFREGNRSPAAFQAYHAAATAVPGEQLGEQVNLAGDVREWSLPGRARRHPTSRAAGNAAHPVTTPNSSNSRHLAASVA